MYNRGYGSGPPPPPPSGPRGGGYGPPGYHATPPYQQHNGYGGPAPPSRAHAGLGMPHAPPNLSRPSNLPATPSPYSPSHASSPHPGPSPSPSSNGATGVLTTQYTGPMSGEKFSLFVGSIADGVENGWLERILEVAGPVLSFRRPSPPFAFVEYSDPESVLRCLEVVNGAQVKTPAGHTKALLVKADEKTRARLDEYERGRVVSETSSDMTAQAKQDLESILARIAAGDSLSSLPSAGTPLASTSTDPAGGSSSDPSASAAAISEANRIANHLKDLAPEDLPDNVRSNTLSSIAAFRERAMKKQTEKRELDRQIEERRQAMIAQRLQQQQARAPGAAAAASSTLSREGSGPATGQGQGQGRVDPQSFNQPIGFVQGSTSNGMDAQGAGEGQARVDPEIDDARRERERAEKEHRQLEMAFKDRERRFEQRERGRLQALEREKHRERSIVEQEDRDRTFVAERLATWDDDREADRGRELFYVDRVRWRAQRRAMRQREEEFDHRDRMLEAQRLALIEQQSDSFLSQHADLFTAPAGSAPGGASTPGGAYAGEAGEAGATGPGGGGGAVKLSFGSVVATAKPKASEQVSKPKRTVVLGLGEDDDEEGRRKRELIPLSYSDDEGEGDASGKPAAKEMASKGMSSREKETKIRAIEDRVPRDKDALFGWKVKWDSLNEEILERRVSPFATKRIVEYLGAEEPELVKAVIDHLRARKPAQELVDELEPVLDEESLDLVTKVWKVVITETELAAAGLA
ncbi:hypothetical protein JCM10212_004470 [Sporobolomyces blumeae]